MGQLISYVQNVSILSFFQLEVSKTWDTIMDAISITTLNFDLSFSWLPVRNDWRTQETLITTCFPLLVVVFVLLFYQPILNVVWYLCLLTSITMVAGAAVIMSQKDASSIAAQVIGTDGNVDIWILLIGICVFVLCIALLIMAKFLKCMQKFVGAKDIKDNRRMTDINERQQRDTKLNWAAWIFRVLLCLILLVFGLFLSGVLTMSFIPSEMNVGSLGDLGKALGHVLFIGGTVGLVLMLLWLFEPVRRAWWIVKHWTAKHFLRVLLLICNIIYLPVMQNILAVFNCSHKSCATGSRFPDDVAIISMANATSCSTCTFFPTNLTLAGAVAQTDYCSAAMQQTLCPFTEQLVLANNWSIQCEDIWYFFWPSSILMAFAFGLGVPWLFWRLIRQTVYRLQAFPLVNAPESEEGKWQMVLISSSSITRSLFEKFERRWRYWQLWELLQKFLIIAVTLFCTFRGYLVVGIILVTAIHVINFIVLVIWRPYVSGLEGKMVILLSFVMSANYTFCIFLSTKLITPSPERPWEGEAITYTLLVVNCVVILLTILVTLLMLRNRKKVIGAELAEERKQLDEEEGKDNVHEETNDETEDEDQAPPPMISYISQQSVFNAGSEEFRRHSRDLGLPPMLVSSPAKPKDTHANMQSPSGNAPGSPAQSSPVVEIQVSPDMAQSSGRIELCSMGSDFEDTEPPANKQPMESSVDMEDKPAPLLAAKGRSVKVVSPVPSNTSEMGRDQVMAWIELQQRTVNFKISQDTETYMSRFFMVSGVLIFIALTFCFAGILQHTFYGNFVPARPYYSAVQLQLVGYPDWTTFGEKCCCLEEDFNVTEKWICGNGYSINRIRQEGDLNGFSVRPYCSRTFDPRCNLTTTNGFINVNCSFAVDATVLEKLW